MQLLTSTNKSIEYERYGEETKCAEYQLYNPTMFGSKRRACVFSNAKGYGLFTETPIVRAVCNEENVDPFGYDFFELRTHIGWSNTPSGHYHFLKLGFKLEGGILYDTEWTDYECPRAVFNAFEHLIGKFWSIDDIVSPNNPKYGNAYQKFSAEQLRQEKEDLAKHLAWMSQWGPRSYEKHPGKILTPAEAKKRGYAFNPSSRFDCLPDDLSQYVNKGMFVDLDDSHLLGQHSSTAFSFEPCGQPQRFTFWRRFDS
jgi:hypothetical protein